MTMKSNLEKAFDTLLNKPNHAPVETVDEARIRWLLKKIDLIPNITRWEMQFTNDIRAQLNEGNFHPTVYQMEKLEEIAK